MNESTATKAIILGVVLFFGLLLVVLAGPFAYVPVGHRGIKTQLGALTGEVRDEGWHIKIPIVNGNHNFEVRVQKVEVEASAASKDLQNVSSKIAVNYAVDPAKVVSLYQSVGDEYDARLIQPAIQESVKSTTAKFTAEELITKRGEVSDQILAELKGRLQSYGLLVSDLNIVDFDFSESFNASIERKVTAQQDALAAENKLKQIEFEAQQAVASSRGKAEAQRIEGEALRANPEVLQLRAVEKWNGVLPQFMTAGSTTPFVNIR